MEIRRRRFLHLAAGAVALPAVSRIAKAQSYPTRPITMIVPLAPGSAIDVIGRVLADRMSKFLLQPIVVENVTGAEGSFGAGRVARARPDGYTVAMGAISTHVLNGALYSLPYDVLNGFASISPVATAPYILFARNTMPAKDLKELIAWLKANPNKASAGISFGSSHVLTAFFQKETGTQLALVPYRGNPFQDLAAGHIDLTFAAPVILPLLRAGNIKAYAVTNELRFAPAPDVPTFAEIALPELSYSAWAGLFAPKGTPNEVIDKLNAAAVEALADPAVRSRLADLGFEIFPRERQTPEALAAMQKADAEKWWPIINATQQRRRQITSYKNTTTSPAMDRAAKTSRRALRGLCRTEPLLQARGGFWPIVEMMAADRGSRFLRNTCRRRPRSSAAVDDPQRPSPDG